MQIRIITDDFTSAADGIGVFAQRGWRSGVALQDSSLNTSFDVTSVDTDSRLLNTHDAAACVIPWAQRWQTADLLVKQFDSTLRGPVAAECLAAWQHSARRCMVVAPAFPSAGRTTADGKVLVNGVPVQQTSFSEDPLNPVTQSDVMELLKAVGIEAMLVRSVADAARALEKSRCIVVDAATEDDLHALVMQLHARTDIFWAGSTGIVRALATALPTPLAVSADFKVHAAKPWVAVGSVNPISRRQALEAEKLVGVTVCCTPDATMHPHEASAGIAQKILQAVRTGQCDAIVATGGETAKAIAQALNATGLQVIREVEPGVPLCLLHLADPSLLLQTLPLITKAGGFGNTHTLANCARILQGLD